MTETVKKYGSRIMIMGCFLFFVHGAKLNSDIVGIDTESMIVMQKGFYGGWLDTGRQGLVGLKHLLGTMIFNPFYAGLMTLVFLTLALGIFLLLWEQDAAEKPGFPVYFLIAAAVWGSHPALTEQLYFALQSMEVCVGIAMTAVSLFCVKRRKGGRTPVRLAAAAAIAVFAFSVYQAFVPLYIFGAVSILLSEAVAALEGESAKSGRELLSELFPYLGVFLAAFLGNEAATRLFFSSSDYLGQQILWGNASVSDIAGCILGHMIQLHTGADSIYYSGFYGVLLAAATVLFVLTVCRRREAKKGVAAVTCFYLISLWLTPFLMTFVCGCAPVVRSQFVLPAATAFWVFLCFRLLEGLEIKFLPAVLTLLCVAGIAGQMQTTLRLYYTEKCRYEQDVARAREMIWQIDRVQGQYPAPVAFVGELRFEGNGSTLAGETMGHSFFEHDARVEPFSYYNTSRILGLMRVLGREYRKISPDRMEEAWEHSYYMPEWPAENSVQRFEDMVVVKLEYWDTE